MPIEDRFLCIACPPPPLPWPGHAPPQWYSDNSANLIMLTTSLLAQKKLTFPSAH